MDQKWLLNKPKQMSRETLAALWHTESQKLLNLAYRMLKNRDEAEDILMDVFVSVPTAIQTFRGEAAISSWLYRMTINACLMKIRKAKRHAELEEINFDYIQEQSIGTKEEKEDLKPGILNDALNALPADTRSMIWLKDAENLSIEELVDIFSMPSGTIKARLSRARAFIRNFIQRSGEYAR